MADLSAAEVLATGVERREPWLLPALTRITRRATVPVVVGLTGLLAAGDLATGVDLTFTLLYLLPIGLGAWFRGRTFGTAIAVVCAAATASIEIGLRLSAGTALRPFYLAWNDGGTFCIFALHAYFVDRLRVYVEKEQRDRRLAIEQLRHAERLNVIGKLAAGVAHELGTPINVIAGSAELIASHPNAVAMTHTLVAKILDQTSRMSTIIRHLLDFGRRGGREKAKLDLAALTREGVALLEPLARKQGARLVIEGGAEPVLVVANRVELGQVLGNLVINAIEAMPAGGTVRVRCESTALSDVDRDRGSARLAVLTIIDEGSGIRPEHLAHVFDPFFTTKDVGQGTGLGLSVSYGIVEDHGGRIHVESRLGGGSRFTVRLPAALT